MRDLEHIMTAACFIAAYLALVFGMMASFPTGIIVCAIAGGVLGRLIYLVHRNH
jgi:hypothetical protein